jgi:hypothetical protein
MLTVSQLSAVDSHFAGPLFSSRFSSIRRYKTHMMSMRMHSSLSNLSSLAVYMAIPISMVLAYA